MISCVQCWSCCIVEHTLPFWPVDHYIVCHNFEGAWLHDAIKFQNMKFHKRHTKAWLQMYIQIKSIKENSLIHTGSVILTM